MLFRSRHARIHGLPQRAPHGAPPGDVVAGSRPPLVDPCCRLPPCHRLTDAVRLPASEACRGARGPPWPGVRHLGGAWVGRPSGRIHGLADHHPGDAWAGRGLTFIPRISHGCPVSHGYPTETSKEAFLRSLPCTRSLIEELDAELGRTKWGGMENRGLEPLTSAVRSQRSTS